MNENKTTFPIILETNILTEKVFNNLIIKNKNYIKNFFTDLDCSTSNKEKIKKYKEEIEEINKKKLESDKKNNELKNLINMNNKKFYEFKNIIDINNKRNEKLIKENEELKNIVDLNNKKIGDHSMYKGEFEEKKKRINFKRIF